MNATLLSDNPAVVEVTTQTAAPVSPVRRRSKRLLATLLLAMIATVGLNIYVFSHAPLRTQAYGFSEVRQIYDQQETLDANPPARLD
jgi:hypothetical protein